MRIVYGHRQSVLRRATAAVSIVALGLAGQSCSTNPATGKKQLNLVSEGQEIAIG